MRFGVTVCRYKWKPTLGVINLLHGWKCWRHSTLHQSSVPSQTLVENRDFRRAMLCRHAVSVCLSVCVSVTFVDSVKTNEQFFSPSGSHTILVLPYQTSWQYSDRNSLNGGVESRWDRLKSRCLTNIWLCDRYRCTVVSISHLAAGFFVDYGYRRTKRHALYTMYSARTTKRGLALYTVTVVRESCVW